jgi:hypothetical protein
MEKPEREEGDPIPENFLGPESVVFPMEIMNVKLWSIVLCQVQNSTVASSYKQTRHCMRKRPVIEATIDVPKLLWTVAEVAYVLFRDLFEAF